MATIHRIDQPGRSYAIVCALFVVSCLLLTRPFAEMGIVDDWSYVATASIFAHTGKFVFNGWGAPLLTWMVPASALGIKLFGFSFTHARLFMLPVTGLAAYLFCRILAAFGIHRNTAIFGTLALFLSPGCLLLEFSLMTDVPGLLAILLCLRLCQKAVNAPTPGLTIGWLWAATWANLLAGSCRQIAWLGALVMVPAAAWMLRRRRGVLAHGIALALLSIAVAKAFMAWFAGHPHTVAEALVRHAIGLHTIAHLCSATLRGALCLNFLLLPVTVAWLWQVKQRPRAARVRALAAAVTTTLLFGALASLHGFGDRPSSWLVPDTLHVLDSMGLAPPVLQEMLGGRVVVEGTLGRILLSALSLTSAYCLWDWLTTGGLNLVVRLRRWFTSPGHEGVRACSWTALAWLLLPFLLANMVMLLPRATFAMMFDRYLLTLLIVALVLLLRLHQDSVRPELPTLSMVTLAVFTLFAIAGTHDLFSLYRARVAAANEVVAAGIPITQVQGGFDFDGWTEVQASGHVDFAQQNDATLKLTGDDCGNWFAGNTPDIDSHYFVARSAVPRCFVRSQFPDVPYPTWLPPYDRALLVLVPKPEFRNTP